MDPEGKKPGTMRLFHKGVPMEDTKSLGFYNIENGDEVLVIWSTAQQEEPRQNRARANRRAVNLFGGDDDDDEDMSDDEEGEGEDEATNDGAKETDVITIFTEHDDKATDVTVDRLKSIQYLRYQLWDELGLRPSNHSLWQGTVDVGGWEDRAFVDESLTIDILFESDEPVKYGERERKKSDPRLTRLETVKQLFHAFVNRSQAYDYANLIGLTLFNNRYKEVCPLTRLFEVFRDHVDGALPNGGTNLYGAINKAGDLLADAKLKHPKASLRILCFTDGEDTLCTIPPAICARTLQINGIVLDAIMIGEGKDNHVLRAMAKATGGYAFAPQSLTEAVSLNELETLLSVSGRPPVQVSFDTELDLNMYADLKRFPLDVCSRDVVPSRELPLALQQPVTSIETALEKATQDASADLGFDDMAMTDEGSGDPLPVPNPAPDTVPNPANNSAHSKNRTRHIMRELSALLKEPHPNFDVYPTQDNIGFWRLIMEIDEGSHYSGGTWLLYVEFPPEYPAKAPEIRFVTPIRHSNVNQYGKICHSIFNRNWTADTNMHTILQCIYGLMLNPDPDDPLDTNLALSFFSASGEYEAAIMKHVEKFAKQKSRADYKREFEAQ